MTLGWGRLALALVVLGSVLAGIFYAYAGGELEQLVYTFDRQYASRLRWLARGAALLSLAGSVLGVLGYVKARRQGLFSLAATLASGFGWMVALPAAAYGAWMAESFGTIMVIPGRPARAMAEPEGGPGALWAWMARAEHESVAVFERLALELRALGAPQELVRRCEQAAREEEGHAALALALARGLGEAVELEPVHLPVRAPSRAVVARESLVDGVLGEGFAAEVARAGAHAAQQPEQRLALAQIAREEQSHASLARDLVSWACEQGDPEVYAALTQARLPWPTTPWRLGPWDALRCAVRAHQQAVRARRQGMVQCRQDRC